MHAGNKHVLARLTHAELKKLACARIVACNFGVHTPASEHTLHTRDAHHECVLYKPRTPHVLCSYSRCRQWITDRVPYTVSLKFLMNGHIHTKYAMIIDSSYLCYDMSGLEPIRSCCIVQNCLHANARKLALICSIYSCKLTVYNRGRGSNFTLVRQILDTSYIFEHVGKGPPIDTQSVAIVWSTISMQSMVIIVGVCGMLPRKIWKNWCSEIEVQGISGI